MSVSRMVEDVALLELPPKIESDSLQRHITQLLAGNQRKIALDLTQITFIESSGLGALVNLYKLCDRSGAKMVVYGIQPYIERLVVITKLDKIIRIAASEEAAISLLQEIS